MELREIMPKAVQALLRYGKNKKMDGGLQAWVANKLDADTCDQDVMEDII
jgi:hypothetical protein